MKSIQLPAPFHFFTILLQLNDKIKRGNKTMKLPCFFACLCCLMSSSLLSKEPDSEALQLLDSLRQKLPHQNITTSDFTSRIPYNGRDIKISSLSITQKKPKGVLFFLTGRSDGFEKYLHRPELFTELTKLGLNIYINDHRGQGLSDRLLLKPDGEEDTSRGFVDDFSNYAEDVEQFQKIIFETNSDLSDLPKFLLSFSMGGTVALNLLDRDKQSSYSGAVFLAPMFRFSDPVFTSFLPYLAIPWIYSLSLWHGQKHYYDPSKDYAISGSGYKGYKLEEIYNTHPSLQLGGSTYNWVYNAGYEVAFKVPYYKIKAPSFVIRAGDDNKVSNTAINEIINPKHGIFLSVTLETIDKAPHELLFADLMVRKESSMNIKEQDKLEGMKMVNETIYMMTEFYRKQLDN